MAPMLLETPDTEPVVAKNVPVCSDPNVVVSEGASRSNKELWWLHGHPHSKRYSDPKLNSLSALVRYNGAVYGEQKAFLYPLAAEFSTAYGVMTWGEFNRTTGSIALWYAEELKAELEIANVRKEQPTIALLGGGRTLEYFCTQLALQKLGIRVLLLAESNALSSLHHLLQTCHTLAVVTDSKNSSIDTNNIRKIDMIETLAATPTMQYSELDAVKFRDYDDVWEQHSFIIHSSGSTGMPKPIIHTNRSMMLIARMYRTFQEFEVHNWFLLFPLYHIAGISIALSNLPNGRILSFPPLAWPPASSAIFTAWDTLSKMGHPVDITHCAPTLIENMYEYISSTTKDFSPLSSLKVLQPGGAALSDSIVKILVQNGVNVKTTYGSTEIGPPLRTIPHSRSNEKCYTFRNLYPDSSYLKMEKVGEGLFECVVYKGFELAAELWEDKPIDEPYRTNDLFIEDPVGSGNYMLQGRKDDTLVHSNGENTSAGPLQLDIQTGSKYINKAFAVGHSKPCVAILVELNADYSPEDTDIRESVWKTVQEVNVRLPGHAQVMQSMIHFLPNGSTLPVTPKGNVKRKEAERIYASEIEALFAEEVIPATTISISRQQEPLSEFLRKLFASLSNISATRIHDWTTLYELNIDSRLALSLRSALQKHLGKSVSLSTIFENPSIFQLVAALLPDTNGSNNHALKSRLPSTAIIKRMISKLETEFKSWPARETSPSSTNGFKPNTPKQETILLTGASGSLGTSLLQTLSSSPHISHIYAMIRGSSPAARYTKILSSFTSRGLDPSPLFGPESKITILPFSMQDHLLGLNIETYYKLARTVTTVIQNAWKMDFNTPVEEFEGDCIRNTISLIRLAYTGCAKRMVFMSSVSACMGSGHLSPVVQEEALGEDPAVALGTGYAQSKYVVERILQSAERELGVPVVVLRVGQMCGHTGTGDWNQDEMWPIMFATAAHPHINAIPELVGNLVDWIPVDIAARAIGEILMAGRTEGEVATTIVGEVEPVDLEDQSGSGRLSTNMTGPLTPTSCSLSDTTTTTTHYTVHNIVNPNPIPWSTLITYLQSSLQLPTTTTITTSSSSSSSPLPSISMRSWVSRLSSLPDSSSVLGLRLLQMFESMVDDESDSKIFDTRKSREISRALRDCPPFCRAWVDANVRRWRECGFM